MLSFHQIIFNSKQTWTKRKLFNQPLFSSIHDNQIPISNFKRKLATHFACSSNLRSSISNKQSRNKPIIKIISRPARIFHRRNSLKASYALTEGFCSKCSVKHNNENLLINFRIKNRKVPRISIPSQINNQINRFNIIKWKHKFLRLWQKNILLRKLWNKSRNKKILSSSRAIEKNRRSKIVQWKLKWWNPAAPGFNNLNRNREIKIVKIPRNVSRINNNSR